VLPANYTFTTTDSGVHTFTNGATLKTAGSQSLTATDTVTSTITGTQAGITVNPAAAKTLTVAGFPSPTTAGTAGSFTVTAKDAFGNIATGYRGTVHFTSTDSKAVLPANYTYTAGDAGVHSFTVTLKTAGTQSITAKDTVTGTITGTQSGITVNPAAAKTLTVAGFPSPTKAGTAGSFTVTAKDAYGNVATGYSGTVQFTSSDKQAVLPANYTYTGSDNGVHTFSATLDTAGTQSLTATDTVTGTITGTQASIKVNPANASTLGVAGFPSPTTAGVAGNVTVTAYDPYGNIASGYRGTVHFTCSDSQAVLPANYTYTAVDAGVHKFSVTLKTAATQSITATDTVTGTITGTQSGITVNPAAASKLKFTTGYPSPSLAGAAQSFTVTALDPYGNVATGYTGTVHFTSNDSMATLPADYTYTGNDAGVHTFSATLNTAGSAQSLTATDTKTGSITGTQSNIYIAPAYFTVTGFPSPTTAGVSQSFTVTAFNANGSKATGYRGIVTFTSSDGKAVLPGNYTFTAGDNGSHKFNATLKTAGTQSLTTTDTKLSTSTGSQTGITVNPAAASTLVVAGFPSPVTAGTAGSFTVTAYDPYGNIATGYTGTIHFTSSDGQAILPANYTYKGGDAGTHSFSATLKTAGTQSITATDTVKSSITGSQTGIIVNAAPVSSPAMLAPGSVTHGKSFFFTAAAVDSFGTIVTGYTGTVHFTSNDQQAQLPANYTFQSTDAGVHTFTNGATLKTAGSQTIVATDPLTSTIPGKQTVTDNAAAAASLKVSGNPSPTMIPADRVFRDWPSSEDAGIPRKLLETGEVVEQLVAALARR
jgi:hypothetical protein